MQQIMKQFFDLPFEEKQRYSHAANDFEGYEPDPVLAEEQVLDWYERLFLKLLPEDAQKPHLWPETPDDLRISFIEYSEKANSVIDAILRAMSRVLNLEENYFLMKRGERALLNAKFNYYPTCRRPDLVLGTKAHPDGTGISVLLPDREVEGLQILMYHEWFRVPIIRNDLLVNIGDQIHIMTNGAFKSPIHRVTVNERKAKITLAIFYLPDPEIEIEPAPELIDVERPQLSRKLKNSAEINFRVFSERKSST